MNSPAQAQAVSGTDSDTASPADNAPHDQQGHAAASLRLAADALKAQPGATEAFAGVAAIQDSLARQENALVAFGNLLVANVKDTGGQTAAMHRLIEVQTACMFKLDHLLQIGLLNAWSAELAKPRHADPKRLLRYGYKVYSQCDEDGIIEEIFKRIGTTNRVFVEFGVESGCEANTVKLLVDGWSGLWLEGEPNYCQQIVARYRSFMEDRRLAVTQCFIMAENINDLIGQSGIRGEIDLLSIDIDFNDYWVWKAIDVISPRVVVIEYNATLHPPLSLTVPYDPKGSWQGKNYYGASLEALVRLGKSKGYRLVGCNYSGANAFFVREDLCKDLFLDPATAEEHYEPLRTYFGFLRAGHAADPRRYLQV